MPPRRTNPAVYGVLPVIKTPGPTSHDVVQIARRVLQERAIGHTGTLDPAAGGLLVLCIGPYTKLVPYLVECDKTYQGEIALGMETNTDDLEGEPVRLGDAASFTLEEIRRVAGKYVGDIQQVPPRFAAVKVEGRKLYEYARKGIEVEVQPRAVRVHWFNLDSLDRVDGIPAPLERSGQPEHAAKLRIVRFSIRVSSGTYVRAIARDLGRDLGCGGTLMSLRRSEVGHFTEQHAMALDTLREDPGQVSSFLVRGAAAIDPGKFPRMVMLTGFKDRLARGLPVNDRMLADPAAAANLRDGAVCALSDEDGVLLAMVQAARFEAQRQANTYDSRFNLHFKPLRVFPGGLK